MTPNPITSGAALEFSLTAGTSGPVKLGEVALLVYSALETRVAIVDLRPAGLPARLDAGQTWSASGTIPRLGLVEGDYRCGVFVNSSDYVGDALDLIELTVRGRDRAGELAPYAAGHRGFLELEARLNSSS